ncbi:MAG: hypothetical protein IJH14_02095 [Solobacterium sp.]|nr:hypothetical protein [Solobacterium sp.]
MTEKPILYMPIGLPASGIAVLHALVINTDIETCIARDRMGARHAGEETIRHVA